MKECGYKNAEDILDGIDGEVLALQVYKTLEVTIRKDKEDELMKLIETIK